MRRSVAQEALYRAGRRIEAIGRQHEKDARHHRHEHEVFSDGAYRDRAKLHARAHERVASLCAREAARLFKLAGPLVLAFVTGCSPCTTLDAAPCDGDAYRALVATQLDTSDRLGCALAPSCSLVVEPAAETWASCFTKAANVPDCDRLRAAIEECGGAL